MLFVEKFVLVAGKNGLSSLSGILALGLILLLYRAGRRQWRGIVRTMARISQHVMHVVCCCSSVRQATTIQIMSIIACSLYAHHTAHQRQSSTIWILWVSYASQKPHIKMDVQNTVIGNMKHTLEEPGYSTLGADWSKY